MSDSTYHGAGRGEDLAIIIQCKRKLLDTDIEGQKPDGIIEYEEYGRTMYMWYYNDLKSNKRGDCLSYSVDVPE